MKGRPLRLTDEQVALLGTDTDAAVAARLGVSESAVKNQRRQREIPAHRPYAPLRGADLTRPTRDLCHEYGVTIAGVARARKAAGVASPNASARVARETRQERERQKSEEAQRSTARRAAVKQDAPARPSPRPPVDRFDPTREPDERFLRWIEQPRYQDRW